MCQCDRTKPCQACCARGHPKECEFIVGEGNDYSPIQQSYEIKDLRKENQKLKKKLQELQQGYHSAFDDDENQSPDRKSSRTISRGPSSRQRRLKVGEKVDNLYFGTPGLASMVSDVRLTYAATKSAADESTVRQSPSWQPFVNTHNAEGQRSVCQRRSTFVSVSRC